MAYKLLTILSILCCSLTVSVCARPPVPPPRPEGTPPFINHELGQLVAAKLKDRPEGTSSVEYWPIVLDWLGVPEGHWLREGDEYTPDRKAQRPDESDADVQEQMAKAGPSNGDGETEEGARVKKHVKEGTSEENSITVPVEAYVRAIKDSTSRFASETLKDASSGAALARLSRLSLPPVKAFVPRIVI
ncbi:MAG: hypothetical protein M1823_004415 [Watsoniomyces obsoletus]|nr:MAG: hypothetical protein M1823_004415 [Watsoniomyces obsoletus]